MSKQIENDVSETDDTGLPWPKSWNGAYTFVICTFVIWIGLLLLLTGFSG